MDSLAISRLADTLKGKMPSVSYNGLKYTNDCISEAKIVEMLNAGYPNDEVISSLGMQTAFYKNLVTLQANLTDSLKQTPSKTNRRRLASTKRAVETVRWLNCLLTTNEHVIVVNIPSATLQLYFHDSIALESKVIVGKRTTRTPAFASVLNDITIYPYWMVPKSIAEKELLPDIKKDISFLERNNFQVLDLKGHIVNPYQMNWYNFGPGNFPYIIRQSTGCDNSLGLIKLNVNDPYNVYLHDTPWKALFESQNRFFSHGCVRVQKAKELAHILLKEKSIAVDTLNENESGLGHYPRVIKLPQMVPVLVLYNTTWYDKQAAIRHYPDIYSKFTRD